MPKPRKPPPDPITRLARLPRQPELTILGGRRTLQAEIDNGGQKMHPQVVLWVEEESQAVIGADIIPLEQSADDGITEAVSVLVNALNGTPSALSPGSFFPPQQIGLPGAIIVNDVALASALTTRLAPLGVGVAYTESLPQIDEFIASLFESLGYDENGELPPPFAWEIAPSALTPLYAAAAKFWRRRPWEYMLDHPTLAVTLGEDGPAAGVETVYAAILGANETVFGVACYFSPEDYQAAAAQGERLGAVEDTALDNAIELMRQQGLPVDVIPRDILRGMLSEVTEIEIADETGENTMAANAMACYFDDRDEIDPTYLAWMTEHNLKAPSREGVPLFVRMSREEEPRQPNEREAHALALTLDALSQFFSRFRAQLEAGAEFGVPLTLQSRVGGDKTPVSVSYTPIPEEGILALDLPAEAATTVYRLQVKLDWMKKVWRRIEIRGNQTLHDLHSAIQAAFDWDDDHLYAFFMSGKTWDSTTEYEGNPLGGGTTGTTPLYSLNLQMGRKFLYIFDFGDELRHAITVEAVLPDGVDATKRYPRVTEVHGAAPAQYADDAGDDE